MTTRKAEFLDKYHQLRRLWGEDRSTLKQIDQRFEELTELRNSCPEDDPDHEMIVDTYEMAKYEYTFRRAAFE